MFLDIAPHSVGVGLNCLQMQTKHVADTDDADQLVVRHNRQMSHVLAEFALAADQPANQPAGIGIMSYRLNGEQLRIRSCS